MVGFRKQFCRASGCSPQGPSGANPQWRSHTAPAQRLGVRCGGTIAGERSRAKKPAAKMGFQKISGIFKFFKLCVLMCFDWQALLFRYPHFWISEFQKEFENRLSVWFKNIRKRRDVSDDSSGIVLLCMFS